MGHFRLIVMGKLSKDEIERHFAEDLPYRTGVLLAHNKMTRKSWTAQRGPVQWLNACFVASLVVGRTYLSMLGIGKSGNALAPFDVKPDDVTFEDLGGTLVDIGTLTGDECALLLGFIIMADKAGAHFTLRTSHPWERSHEAIEWIYRHLKTNLYDAAKRTGLEPWA
jgi:hypothetical protein